MLSLLVTLATDTPPEDNDVVAGGWGALVLVGLIVAVVFLGFSLVKQLRKAQAAEEAGVYGHDDAAADPGETPADPAPGETVADERADDQRP
jgi:hypothetical protein